MYLGSQEEYLSIINLYFLKTICVALGIQANFKFSSDFEIRGDKTDALLSICQDLGANTYCSGPAAQEYMDIMKFHKAGIAVELEIFTRHCRL